MAETVDNHTLFVRYGMATKQQVEDTMANVMKQISRLPKSDLGESTTSTLSLGYEINHPINKEGKTMGSAYVWIDSPVVYNILLGKDVKGHARFEYKDNPKKTSETKANTKMSWADIQDEDDGIYNKIKVELPSLIVWPSYTLDEQQKKDYFERYKKTVDTDTFRISQTKVKVVDQQYVPHSLCVSNVPPEMSEDMLYQKFKRYATVKSARVSGGVIQFPQVNINNRNGKITAYITYSNTSRDASFALLMTKKFTMVITGKPYTMYVAHCLQRR